MLARLVAFLMVTSWTTATSPAQIRLGFADPAASTGSVTATDRMTVVHAALVTNGSGAVLDGKATTGWE